MRTSMSISHIKNISPSVSALRLCIFFLMASMVLADLSAIVDCDTMRWFYLTIIAAQACKFTTDNCCEVSCNYLKTIQPSICFQLNLISLLSWVRWALKLIFPIFSSLWPGVARTDEVCFVPCLGQHSVISAGVVSSSTPPGSISRDDSGPPTGGGWLLLPPDNR